MSCLSDTARKARPSAEPVKDPLQRRDNGDCDKEHEQRQHADIEIAGKGETCSLNRAGVHLLRIGAVDFQEPVLDDHRKAECDQKRRKDIVAESLIENAALEHIAKKRHQRHDQQECEQGADPQRACCRKGEEGCQDR